MMRIRVVLAAVAATVAGAALLLAQPAADRGVTGTTITFGLEEQFNSSPPTNRTWASGWRSRTPTPPA